VAGGAALRVTFSSLASQTRNPPLTQKSGHRPATFKWPDSASPCSSNNHHRRNPAMTTAVSSNSDPSHPSPSRGQTSRSQSTRSRAPSASASSPQRAASTSNHHNHSRQSSSARPVQDILPQNDMETSNLANYSKRSPSKDRPPTSTRTEAPRPHRRSSSKSTHNSHGPHPDMPSNTGVANNAGPAPVAHGVADARQSNARHSRSRTTIPTQSGKWILGKTIGAGSMGKVKLARKEDGTEQVSCFPVTCCWIVSFQRVSASGRV
jgi:serine/threonine protein kinase KIN1/2